jgi:spermidine synthase
LQKKGENKMKKEIRVIIITLFLLSFASLVTEISLIRVFDVLFFPNISYMIITCSLFAYGLAGVYSSIKPISLDRNFQKELGKLSFFLAVSLGAILPVMNLLPFDLNKFSTEPVKQLIYFGGVYIALALPFFLTGLMFSAIFSVYAEQIQRLYFWDLIGAALGSAMVIPFISLIGPGGLLFFTTALSLAASALFLNKKPWTLAVSIVSLALIVAPIAYAPHYFDFVEHQGKRGVKLAREQGMIETTIWDPISKIDIIKYDKYRYIAYDGGSQTSLFYPFNGNYQALRQNLPNELTDNFWQRGILVSHFLKDGTNQNVLVIGSAGGQEIKAALMYGAEHVDGLEMVGSIVELGKDDYADYIGGLFLHPAVSVYAGEGRSFLRSSEKEYDIVQIFSNHTSSSVAAGTGALSTNYLQTSDAYREYFSHLSENGILHINHHNYPRMITTAALAWVQIGRSEFEKHVIVYERSSDETLPTLLIKMQPWTADELEQVKKFFAAQFPSESNIYTLVVDPLSPENNSIPLEYFSGSLSAGAVQSANLQIEPATDDRPYFNLNEKTLNPLTNGVIQSLKNPFEGSVQGLITLYMTGIVAVFYALIFILIPLFFSSTGKQVWHNKLNSLLYFSCLGAGFIIIEFVFIQEFMHMIGSPLYTYSTVLFTVLLGAGIGSISSERMGITPDFRWFVPFIGIFITLTYMLFLYPSTREFFLAMPLLMRVVIAFLFIFPVGFFLGMPFPLGILTLQHQPKGSIAWAWGMNGLFTVIGGLLGIIFSVQWGFNTTLLIAGAIYMVAFLVFSRIRSVLT